MTTSAVPPTTPMTATGPSARRWPDDDATDDGKTPRTAVARHGRSLPATVGERRSGGAHLRRTVCALGGPALYVAREQRDAVPAEDVAARRRSLRRGRQLPPRAETGSGTVPLAAELAVGGPAHVGNPHRPHRDWQVMVVSSAGA